MTVHVPPPASVDLDQACRFLAKALPWPESGEGYINISGRKRSPEREKPSGRAVLPVTLDEAAGRTPLDHQTNGETRNLRLHKLAADGAGKRRAEDGKEYLAPIPNQQNVIALKSLYLDIDSKGGDHGYDTRDDAIEAIAGFLKASGFPKPEIIVKSGGGLHIYFTLSSATEP